MLLIVDYCFRYNECINIDSHFQPYVTAQHTQYFQNHTEYFSSFLKARHFVQIIYRTANKFIVADAIRPNNFVAQFA